MTTVNSVNTYIVPTAANEVTMPSQPAFLGYLATDDLNVTGDGTVFILGDTDVGTALTEVFDQNADFVTGSSAGAVFTAPVTGRYFLAGALLFLQAAAGTTADIYITTSNRTYRRADGCDTDANNNGSIEIATLADMDATDTATISGLVNGVGALTVDVDGSVSLISWFAGNLAV